MNSSVFSVSGKKCDDKQRRLFPYRPLFLDEQYTNNQQTLERESENQQCQHNLCIRLLYDVPTTSVLVSVGGA